MKYKINDLVEYPNRCGVSLFRVVKVFPNFRGKGLKGYSLRVEESERDFLIGNHWASVKEESIIRKIMPLSIDFREIRNSVKLLMWLEKLPLSEIAERFADYSQQAITKEMADKFALTGFGKVDFLTSGYLCRHYGLRNLLDIIK